MLHTFLVEFDERTLENRTLSNIRSVSVEKRIQPISNCVLDEKDRND